MKKLLTLSLLTFAIQQSSHADCDSTAGAPQAGPGQIINNDKVCICYANGKGAEITCAKATSCSATNGGTIICPNATQ